MLNTVDAKWTRDEILLLKNRRESSLSTFKAATPSSRDRTINVHVHICIFAGVRCPHFVDCARARSLDFECLSILFRFGAKGVVSPFTSLQCCSYSAPTILSQVIPLEHPPNCFPESSPTLLCGLLVVVTPCVPWGNRYSVYFRIAAQPSVRRDKWCLLETGTVDDLVICALAVELLSHGNVSGI